jgi:hypothetical protein
MAELSPQAQAVWDAAYHTPAGCSYEYELAAALEKATNEVISPVPPPCKDFDEYAQGFLAAHVKYRANLLAIVAELRGDTTTSTETP